MAKNNLSRFTDTLTNVVNEKAAGYTLGKKAVDSINTWLKTNPSDKNTLGGKISLGGIRLRKTEDETYLRHLRRGVLLLHRTAGGGNDVSTKTLSGQIKNENKMALRARLQGMIPVAGVAAVNKVIKAPGGFGTFELSQGSWQHSNSQQEHEAGAAFTKASLLVNKAMSQGIMRLSDNQQKLTFERWFGPANNAVNVATVKANLKKIHKAICTRTVKLYFRGSNKVEGKNTDLPINEPWSADGKMHLGGFFGAAWRVAPAAFDNTKSHMMLGQPFFEAVRNGTDSCAGVIVHELSHSEAQTNDHPHPVSGADCYGHVMCKDIATNYTNLAISNADNYEFYCEEFWEGVFETKPQAAVNPIPDTVKRQIQNVIST